VSMEPVCMAIMLSDMIIKEHGSGKLSLINCFSAFNAPTFPFASPPFFVTVLISNLEGKVQELHLTVRIEDDQSGFVLANAAGHIKFPEDAPPLQRTDVLEIPFRIPRVNINSAGTYVVNALLNNDSLGKRHFCVRALTAPAQRTES